MYAWGSNVGPKIREPRSCILVCFGKFPFIHIFSRVRLPLKGGTGWSKSKFSHSIGPKGYNSENMHFWTYGRKSHFETQYKIAPIWPQNFQGWKHWQHVPLSLPKTFLNIRVNWFTTTFILFSSLFSVEFRESAWKIFALILINKILAAVGRPFVRRCSEGYLLNDRIGVNRSWKHNWYNYNWCKFSTFKSLTYF